MTPRIMLIEDEVLIAMQISDALEDAGFIVVGPYQTVAQALDTLKTPDCCDAAILDANLRNQSAAPVASALAALAIPFLVTTGYDRDQLPGELAAAQVLTKPLRTEDLIDALKRKLSD